MATTAYLRASMGTLDLANQKLAILECVRESKPRTPHNLPEDRRKWSDSCRREKPEFSLMLLVGSKVSDFDPGISLRKPLSFLMPNVLAQECYLTRTVAWQNLRFQNLPKEVPL